MKLLATASTLCGDGGLGLLGVMARTAHTVQRAPVPNPNVLIWCYMDKIRFQTGDARESGAAVCAWVQLCSHLLSSSGARNDSRGKRTGKGGWDNIVI